MNICVYTLYNIYWGDKLVFSYYSGVFNTCPAQFVTPGSRFKVARNCTVGIPNDVLGATTDCNGKVGGCKWNRGEAILDEFRPTLIN